MPSLPIHATLNFPTTTSHPSPTCLQWSAEGQLIFATKSAAYVLTPAYGITHDNASAIKSSFKKENTNEQQGVGWFRTIVQFDSGEAFKWPEYSQDWGAVSLGSIDLTLLAVAVSPSGLSSTSGCIVATLSSNLDFTLWTATRNSLKGEWTSTLGVTAFLIEKFQAAMSEVSQMARTLRAQVVSICWTPQPDFGIAPVPGCNGSLLIAGNRAGSVLFLRYVNGVVELVHDLTLGSYWTNLLAFSKWALSDTGKASGTLAYGNSAGAIGLLEVSQNLIEETGSSLFGPSYAIQTEVQDLGLIHQPDQIGITSMRWISPPSRSPILVINKPGRLLLWSSPSGTSNWSGSRILTFKNQKIHKSSSPFHPMTGLSYISSQDLLLVTLADGSFHVIQNVSSDPSWSTGYVNSQQASKAARSVFVETQHGDADLVDMNKITGAASFDDRSTLVWAQEAMRPSDFSYKHEAKHNSCLIVSQLWDDDENSDNMLLQDLATLFQQAKASGRGTLDLLRPYLFRWSDKTKLNEMHPRVLQALDASSLDDHSLTISIPPCTSTLSEEVRRRFRESLSKHLFGYDALVSLRIRLAFADFTWKHSDTEDKRHNCGVVAQKLLSAVSHRTVRTIIRHLGAIVSLLHFDDVPFILRTVVQSLLPGSPRDLSNEARALSEQVQTKLPSMESPEVEEHCPACGVTIPLVDITVAVCSNDHHWGMFPTIAIGHI
ncbi:hypothetical protein D9756_007082 [Leucocoprinus leucothites]|uniref:Transcription factor IIIC 90kDa subunit N-terminal domain-containing protein n=1 Tax=Leucocoprinus leucothites TaxID=201217 RepID=A0A8H5FZ04_9AGAR|nr:hypothetical protein D9756_007082 [Leucoagaricus leucothites]